MNRHLDGKAIELEKQSIEGKLEILGHLIVSDWRVRENKGRWELHTPDHRYGGDSLLLAYPTFAELVNELQNHKVQWQLKVYNRLPNGEKEIVKPMHKSKTNETVFS
jgi:hypothetical protein